MAKPSIRVDYETGARPGGEELARLRGRQLRLGDRVPPTPVDDHRLGADLARVPRDRPQVLDLERLAGVADSRRERGVDRAAERGVEDGRGITAVDHPDRVVMLLAGLALEDRPPLLQLCDREVHDHRDRRRRYLTRLDRADVVEPRHLGPDGGARYRVVPGDGPAPQGLSRIGIDAQARPRRLHQRGRSSLRSERPRTYLRPSRGRSGLAGYRRSARISSELIWTCSG